VLDAQLRFWHGGRTASWWDRYLRCAGTPIVAVDEGVVIFSGRGLMAMAM
jgi:hypothetical protein